MRKILFILSMLLASIGARATTTVTIDGNKYELDESKKTALFTQAGSAGDFVIPSTVTYNDDIYTVTSIDIGAFPSGEDYTSITIPNTITSIGSAAFRECSNLSSIELPSSLTSIGEEAFRGCTNLTSLIIPANVEHIGRAITAYCQALESIVVDGNNTYFDSRNHCNAIISKADNCLVAGCKETLIPEDVTQIGYGAFFGCFDLTSVMIPSGITVIGTEAFRDCYGLSSICLPDNITMISYGCFNGCKNLTSLSIPSGVTTIRDYAFSGCVGLTSLTIPEGVTKINNYVFQDCTNLTTLNLHDNIVHIGDGAFKGCTNLTSLNITDNVKYIGQYAFSGCSSLTSLHVPSGLTSIEPAAFSHCTQLTSLTLPKGITSIGHGAFYGCSQLSSLHIPNGVTTLGYHIFRDCSNLKSIIIPNSVNSIGEDAFYDCNSLKSVTLPNSITKLEPNVFYGCSSLVSVTLPSGLKSIDVDVFKGCTALKSVNCFATKMPTINTTSFPSTLGKNLTVHVLPTLVDLYNDDYKWKRHNIVGYAEEVILDETGISTLCSYAGMDFSTVEGLKAYIISSFVPSEGKAVLTRVEEVPEKTGVLLMGNPGTYTIPMSIGETSLANLLVGVTEATNLNATDGDYTNYALQTDGEIGFYAVTDNFSLAANSAYLPLPTDHLPAAARSITFRFNDETEEESTGITSASVTGNKATAIYNLNGQRLTTLQKGLNIVGGKKIFKK